MTHDDHDIDIMAKTIWGEARGEELAGQIAVAWVIRNRAERYWAGRLVGMPGAVAKVCLQPWQFSCWNENDPNYAKLLRLAPETYETQREIARRVLDGTAMDPTNGSDHYHTTGVAPAWKDSMKQEAAIGNHLFYNSRQAV
jgi:spore germination cell wall hydrolase CwlJ-like protein